jgi:PPOX class probable FMN-dependent enzyme
MNDQRPDSFIATEEELRSMHGPVGDLAARKCMPKLDPHTKRFMSLSPFLCIASSRPGGAADISPRGDAPGFVGILDDTTILIPDRLGNNRLDTSSNILENPHVGLIFMVPGLQETLRINGRARICTDAGVLAGFAVNGKVPATGLLVEIDEVMFQCAKALVRSRLWDDDYKVGRDAMPPLGKIIKDQIETDMTAEEAEVRIQESLRDRLY